MGVVYARVGLGPPDRNKKKRSADTTKRRPGRADVPPVSDLAEV
jgi:hypothetical protein